MGWDEVRANLEVLSAWLKSIGFDRPHRFEQHRRNVLSMFDSRNELRANLTPEAGHELLWSIGESWEFIATLTTLRERCTDADLHPVLQRALQGPTYPLHENSDNNTGRNFTFELVIAAHFAKAGF